MGKSIFLKFLISFVVFAALLGAVFFIMDYMNIGEISLEVVGLFLGILAVYVLGSFFYLIVRPMRKVMSQMQLLMNGKKYKKIYTSRVDEVGVLAHFFNQVTENFSRVAEDVEDRERILDELSVAAELQKEIFPESVPKIDGLEIVAKNRPATELGGDSYDFIESGDKVYVYVGDVTGHGVTAGLIMAMVNAMIDSFAGVYTSAKEILLHTNSHIKKYVKPSMYMTLVMLCWDKKTKKMTYVGAGHEHILIYRKETGEIEDVVSGGTALGMVEDASKTLNEKEIALNNGDMIILYSDGITEAKNGTGGMYGLDRLKENVQKFGSEYGAAGVNSHVAKDLSAFVGDESQIDDMTLIVLEKK